MAKRSGFVANARNPWTVSQQETQLAGEEKRMSRLRVRYQREIMPALQERFGYRNVMAVPKLEKIVVNIGLGEAIQNPKLLDSAMDELGAITGQRPIVNRARKSIASFKLRQGMAIACSVTLRAARMYEFFDRLINIALPRVRDFRGLSTRSFDGRGNYTLGLRDQLVFPEIDYSKVSKIKGMNVCMVTSAKTDDEAKSLLGLLGLPYRR
jgi:large subunit ribosomal protein L5